MTTRVHIIAAAKDGRSQDDLLTHLKSLRPAPAVTCHNQVPAGLPKRAWQRDQIKEAAVVVVLLSPHLGELLADAEQAVKRPGCVVLPVRLRDTLLDGSCFKDMACLPVTGKALASLDARDRDKKWSEVAEEVKRRAPAAPQGSRLIRYRQNLGAALKLDRSHQWRTLQQRCGRDEPSTLFLLHGPRAQHIDKFSERIESMLGPEHDLPHRTVTVPFVSNAAHARTADDWMLHLRQALASALPSASGDAVDLLRTAADDVPLFLFIGERPFDRMRPEYEAALGDLLARALPQAIADANAEHPVRALVAADYRQAPDASLVPSIHRWGGMAEGLGVRYCPLDPITQPTWDEVEEYMTTHDPRPAPEDIDTMKAEYTAQCARNASFLELADELDRFLLKV